MSIPEAPPLKVGMRCPARVTEIKVTGCRLKLDVRALVPGWYSRAEADLFFEETVASEKARAMRVGQRTEVVVIDVSPSDGYLAVSLPADPAWLSWNNGTVRLLAQRIRACAEVVLLPVLADALEEAGCTDAAVLAYCRQPQSEDLRSWVAELLSTQE